MRLKGAARRFATMAERDEVDRATGARRMVAPRHVKLGDRMILQTARFAIVANPDAGDEP
jgi:hypothetical protein